MDYAEFKDHLTVFLWRQNDVDLAARLDTLIRMGENELNRVLDIQRRQVTVNILPETEDYVLPTDFRHIVSLHNNTLTSNAMMTSTTLGDIYLLRQRTNSSRVVPLYAIDEGVAGAKILRLVGPFSVDTPGSLILVYRNNVPNFQVTDASWLEADFLDLYTYTVLMHTTPFLKDDERLQLWQTLKDAAILSAIDEDKHKVTHGGSPMQMRPHRIVP